MAKYDLEELEEIQEEYEALLMGKENVIGVGIAEQDGNYVLKVFVKKKVSRESENAIPQDIEGVPVVTEEMDAPYAFADRTTRYRPAQPGVSIGHYEVTAGTFGAVVEYADKKGDLILSNNHVLANANNCKIGDDILQQGRVDGGKRDTDVIGKLKDYVPINFKRGTSFGANSHIRDINDEIDKTDKHWRQTKRNLLKWKKEQDPYWKKWHDEYGKDVPEAMKDLSNYVDMALAEPIDPKDINYEIMEIGYVQGVGTPTLGLEVKKSGRTTGLTTGTIKAINATVEVGYGFGTKAVFKKQIITSDMSKGGDSGSLLLDKDNNAVGLLFAGTRESTIHNRIDEVLKARKLNFRK